MKARTPDGAPHPGMIVSENMIVEIVRPGTDDPVAEGEVGELVVTTLNPGYPLIRFGTGDLSAISARRIAMRPHRTADSRLDGPRRPANQGQGHVCRSQADRRGAQAKHPEIARARLVVSRSPKTPTR
jgi:phenylacetate-CoA ligase